MILGVSIPVLKEKLRVGKTCGDDCLYPEMIKTNHEGLVSLISRVFTDIMHGTADVPATWTVSRLIVLYKKRRGYTAEKIQTHCDYIRPQQTFQWHLALTCRLSVRLFAGCGAGGFSAGLQLQ